MSDDDTPEWLVYHHGVEAYAEIVKAETAEEAADKLGPDTNGILVFPMDSLAHSRDAKHLLEDLRFEVT